jgi:tRNA(Ile)-lysidine synthase
MKKQTPTPPYGFKDPRALAGLPKDTPLCVALSGGADSVALLSMLSADPNVCAVHVHHGIRGAEADRDADFCRDLAGRLGVPLTVLSIDAPAMARALGVSLETAARDGRYEAITAHLKKENIPLLVTAHHADDQLETILQHLLRGSGLSGLCGIPACRRLADGVLVARPLLTVTREALRDYLEKAELSHVEDSTNAEGCCTRNRLRLEVLPALSELYPAGVEAAARCAELLLEDEGYLDSLAADFLQKEGDEPSLPALAALPRPIFARVMRKLLPASPERVHIEALAAFCQKATPHATLSLPRATVAAENGRLTVVCEPDTFTDYEIVLREGETPLPEIGGLAIVARNGENCETHPNNVYKYSTQLSFCSAIIDGKLSVRNRRAGDRIRSGGMHKAVRRLQGQEHLPLSVRKKMPLLADDSGVLAVPFLAPRAVMRDGALKKNAPRDITVFLFFN